MGLNLMEFLGALIVSVLSLHVPVYHLFFNYFEQRCQNNSGWGGQEQMSTN